MPDTDSRLQRYINILKKSNNSYLVVGWDRENNISKFKDSEIIYNKPAPIGGGVKNIFQLILWNIFIFRVLFKYKKEYKNIHSVDFDTVLPALFFKLFFRKNLIFDIYDKYTDARKMPKFISFFIDKLEYFSCLMADKLILPDICRVKQLGLKNISPLIIENVPYSDNIVYKEMKDGMPIVVSYVGILERNNRGLENLINAVKKYPEKIVLHIAGDGELRKVIESASLKFKNIIYFGPVGYDKALDIMSNSNLIVGMYYKTIKNHLYASPNKYYEHLFLGRALLTTIGTPPGDRVLEFNTGFVVGENVKDLTVFLENLSLKECKIIGKNAKIIWDKFYANYWRSYATNAYTEILKIED
ncbi:glycosyltransferase [Campylobacter ureolyticus]|uniref:glycosyltransferase n=1 Tax=Campylobacter ureolyticus TaxID=827 RepID=UPI001594B6D2|nr:glycosyltransferase [Campylobacter ureolyticus]